MPAADLLRFPLLLALLGAPLAGTGPQDAPAVCPYCKNDSALLQAAGLVSHGPFPFAGAASADVEKHIAYSRIYWLESAHHRLGSMLPPYTVPERETKKIRAELKELKAFFPKIDEKTRHLDPWLRLHLMALRSEKWYAEFLGLLGLKESDFPDGSTVYDPTTGKPYQGEGPYLGEKDKYELFLADSMAAHQDLLVKYFGVTTKKPQRWNVLARHCLLFSVSAKDENLNGNDTAIHCCVVHNLAHNYVDGFQYYAYDLPVWFTEGFAHWAQRTIHPAYVNYDNVEGSNPLKQSGEGWPAETRRILGRGRAASLADLTRKNSFAELDQNDHIVVWSRLDFLIATDRAKFAAFLDRLKGRTDEKGFTLSRGLGEEQREALKEVYGWSYPEFEEAWKAYVLATYAAQ